MQWNDDILEEDDVLVTQRHCKARDDGGQDIEQLCRTVELMRLVDQRVEGFIHGLADHLPARHQLKSKGKANDTYEQS